MKLSIRFRVTAIGVGVVAAALVTVACSSDDSNSVISPVFDSGAQDSTITTAGDSSTNTADSAAGDSSTPSGDSSSPPTDSGSAADSAFVVDSSLPDAGACVSDAAPTGFGDAQICNSCFSPAQDPLNGCPTSATIICVPYDNSQLPVGAP